MKGVESDRTGTQSQSESQFQRQSQSKDCNMKNGDTEEEEEASISTIRTRLSMKTHQHFNNYESWKHKLRENCYKRVREDRSRLLWKMRLPLSTPAPHSLRYCEQDFVKTAFRDIVSDELKRLRDSSLDDNIKTSTSDSQTNDVLWEYDGLHDAYKGECEEILLEMQRIFYEDLKVEPARKETDVLFSETDGQDETWEDEQDEFLARAVYQHMQLNDEHVPKKEIYCPICKRGELQENYHNIYCTYCKLKLNKENEVTLEYLCIRLADAHAEHLDRGCRLKPMFCIESRFNVTALYIQCRGCNTFEVIV